MALLLAAAPPSSSETAVAAASAPAARAPEPRMAVWLQAGGPLLTLVTGGRAKYLPFGVSVAFTERVSLAVEASALFGHQRYDEGSFGPGTGEYSRLVLGAGPVFSFGPGALRGAFLSPKAFVVSGWEDDYFADEIEHVGGRTTEVQVGLDAGLQTTLGAIHLALVFGASAGVCFGCVPGSTFGSIAAPLALTYDTVRVPLQGVAGLNLNLLRVGGTF